MVLDGIERIAHGRVRFRDEPVVAAQVSLHHDDWGRLEKSSGREAVVLSKLRAYSDPRGAFALFGPAIPEDATVRATSGWRQSADARLDSPDSDGPSELTLELHESGSVAGTLVHDLARTTVQVTLIQADAPPLVAGYARTAMFGTGLDAQGPFVMRGVAPGHYDMVVHVDNYVLKRIENVVVPSGASVEDPRLRSVRATDSLEDARIVVLDADGQPVPRARVSVEVLEPHRFEDVVRLPGAPVKWRHLKRTDARGAAHFVVPKGASCLVEGVGRDGATARAVSRQPALTLRLGHETRLKARITPSPWPMVDDDGHLLLVLRSSSKAFSRVLRRGQTATTFQNLPSGRYEALLVPRTGLPIAYPASVLVPMLDHPRSKHALVGSVTVEEGTNADAELSFDNEAGFSRR